jgi:hypothetical protein
MIHTPEFYLYRIASLLEAEIESQFEILASDQAKLEDYKAKFPDKVLYINERQKLLNLRSESLETMNGLLDHVPNLLKQEQSRCIVKGIHQEQAKHKQVANSWFFTTKDKETARHQSIIDAQTKYNF